jgi:hypothetical protein
LAPAGSSGSPKGGGLKIPVTETAKRDPLRLLVETVALGVSGAHFNGTAPLIEADTLDMLLRRIVRGATPDLTSPFCLFWLIVFSKAARADPTPDEDCTVWIMASQVISGIQQRLS